MNVVRWARLVSEGIRGNAKAATGGTRRTQRSRKGRKDATPTEGLGGAQARSRATSADPALDDGPIAMLLLPLGAVEAHGPHLPPETDTLIAVALAREAAKLFHEGTGARVHVAEPFTRTAASCAAGFPETVSVDAATERTELVLVLRSWLAGRAQRVALVNLHFDPEHLRAVRGALDALDGAERARVSAVDLTRRAHAQRIGGEFATGSCHAGEYETSLLLATAPERVDPIYRKLPENFVDLPAAMRAGKRTFAEMGLPDAYCGWPARASAKEGERLYRVMAEILVEAWREAWTG